MKKYHNLGDLLIDYRKLSSISQHEFAASLDVDVRTIQRWEKNTTLVKIEKESDLVEATFLPHQLIRNLNTTNPIPTFYDFRIRKYSLSVLTNDLPDIELIKEHINVALEQIRPIDIKTDLKYIKRYVDFQYENKNIIQDEVLIQAIKLLPDLNLLLTDMAGYYAGHTVTLPISPEAYQKLHDRAIYNHQLTISDLVDYRTQEKPLFYGYNITADSNIGVYYILGAILKYFVKPKFNDYLYCSVTNRHDSEKTHTKLGVKTIWKEKQSLVNCKSNPIIQFFEGNFKEFLSNS